MFTAKAKVCGIIGNPVEHSMSPVLHAALSEKLGVDMAYVPLLVTGDLKKAVEGAYELGFTGMNITMPYKEDIMKYCTQIDPFAESVGAVNTLVRHQDGFHGFNTDLNGLQKSVRDAQIPLKGEHVMILGAGGAAKAVGHMCMNEGIKSLTIINRNKSKADILAEELSTKHPGTCEIKTYALDEYKKADQESYVVFQSTNVGMCPKPDEIIIDDEAFYDRCIAGIDLIYNPYETLFLKRVASHGAKTLGGMNMLIGQGVLAFELWNPDVTVTKEAVDYAREHISKLLKERSK